ncbi:MAG: hypothetical protein KC584_10570, partial [Nitrospira sp.]|nr:hypothetical protein [Nitrospira sp.]
MSISLDTRDTRNSTERTGIPPKISASHNQEKIWKTLLNARSEGNSITVGLDRPQSHQAKDRLSVTKWSPVTFM